MGGLRRSARYTRRLVPGIRRARARACGTGPSDGRVFGLSATTANTAGLTGHIELVKVASPAQGFVEGNYLTIRITDNAEPRAADVVNFDPGTTTPPASCAGVGDLAISQGNYVVHDDLVDLSAFNLLLSQFEAAAGDPYGTG